MSSLLAIDTMKCHNESEISVTAIMNAIDRSKEFAVGSYLSSQFHKVMSANESGSKTTPKTHVNANAYNEEETTVKIMIDDTEVTKRTPVNDGYETESASNEEVGNEERKDNLELEEIEEEEYEADADNDEMDMVDEQAEMEDMMEAMNERETSYGVSLKCAIISTVIHR